MQLVSFRIQNFRSIADSGEVDVSKITALLGRNESGKSNLLLGLRTLNPVDGLKALNPTKDFPRHRRLTECNEHTEVVSSRWKLSAAEKKELGAILSRAASVDVVKIGRRYGATRWVSFDSLAALELDQRSTQTKIGKITAAVSVCSESKEEPHKAALAGAAVAFSEIASANISDKQRWAADMRTAAAAIRQALVKADVELKEKQEADLADLEVIARDIDTDADRQQKARDWAASKLPLFIYLADYPDLEGHQNISEYVQRKNQGRLSDADLDFEKLCKVAGLDPVRLHALQGEQKSEERNQLANRASAVVTGEIRKLWKDRALKVRFNLDGIHFDTLISDPTATYDVEVNLDERSRGFKWFFSFYITFAADTDGGSANNAVLLLDEPGLYLHIQSQKDLLAHWEKDFDNQIIYTTHSPFMVPVQTLDRLRTVNISEEAGTVVTNNPTGDARTLAPIRAALGYFYVDSFGVNPNNLILEGVTDGWILEAVSAYLVANGKDGLPNGLALCPVDGASKVPNMVSFLQGQKLEVGVLFDDDTEGRRIRDQMVKSKQIRERAVKFVSEALDNPKPAEADIEDLIDPAIYEALVETAYSKELREIQLNLNKKIPRIVKRFEAAFEEANLVFHKTRPAGLFFRKMATEPGTVMSADMAQRFERLFALIKALGPPEK